MADEQPPESRPARLRRWWGRLVAAGRWAYDVGRGFSWSRHLDRREK